MWIYEQTTGQLYSAPGQLAGTAYSGHGIGRNNPELQWSHNVGPVPRGEYTIGPPHNTTTHGPFVMSLTPDDDNAMFGRSGFLIHGDNVRNDASLGCIVASRELREKIWLSGDHRLVVVH